MNKLLLLNLWNTNVRSFVISLGIVVAVAGLEVLNVQATDGHYNLSVVIGAAVAAGIKFLHSAVSRAMLNQQV